MAEPSDIDEAADIEAGTERASPEPHTPEPRRWLEWVWRGLRALGTALFVLAALIALGVAFLHTGTGRQFIADRIAKFAPASGLTVRVARIEGSVLWSSTFYEVEFRDANGTLFLEVPEVDFNWRPLKFPFGELDIRHLVLHDGTLYSAPELDPSDPDTPLLPDLDIRLDRLVIDDLRVAEGLLGEERLIQFGAEADIRDGLVFVDADGELGGGDLFAFLIHAEPDGDRFDLDLDYRAPVGGFLAAIAGAEEELTLRIEGDGSWSSWEGVLQAVQGSQNLADLKLYNNSGTYRIAGRANPGSFLSGIPARALGSNVALAATGTLVGSVAEGSLSIRGRGVNLDARGAVDLADNRFEAVKLDAVLLDKTLFGEGLNLSGVRLSATLDGLFRGFSVSHRLSVDQLDAGGTIASEVVQQGVLTFDGTRMVVPLDMRLGRIVSGNKIIDPRLKDGRIGGTLIVTGDRLLADDLAVHFPGLMGKFALRGDLARGTYGLDGPVTAEGLVIESLGAVDARADIQLRMGAAAPWHLRADLSGRIPRVTNGTLAALAGSDIRFSGDVTLGEDLPVTFQQTRLEGSKLSLTFDGQMADGRTALAGDGRHVDYGQFTVEAEIADDGPRAALVFANPLPAAGLRDVHVALAPAEQGFTITTNGQSLLGAFDGLLALNTVPGQPARIDVERLNLQDSRATGSITLGENGFAGQLDIGGGGLDGTAIFAPRDGGQAFDISLVARNARFSGLRPLVIGQARITAEGFITEGRTTVTGDMRAGGIRFGDSYIASMAGRADIENGIGRFDASISGRRRNRFDLQLAGNIAPEQISLAARGSYAGRAIAMPRRAVLQRTNDGGWALHKTQLTLGQGIMIAEGRFGGTEPVQGRVSLSDMPLFVVDLMSSDLGFGGSVSGIVDLGSGPGGEPVGEARLMIANLTRSGLILSSRPLDLALVANLSPSQLQLRAVFAEESDTKGRLQARISNLPAEGPLFDRLYAGNLRAQLRYEGPADSLWRLTALELIDITGPVKVAADIEGSLGDPQVRGSVAGDALRLQSAATGTDIRKMTVQGRFIGSRLQLTGFSGTARGGGQVSGSGFIDLAGMTGSRGPKIDLRIATRKAQILDLRNMGATVSGPVRIVSNGVGGTIAGRLRVSKARWRLGREEEVQPLPNIPTREINLPPDRAALVAEGAPWRYLIDVTAAGGVEVDGMGLDSEWRGDIILRGTTEDPRVGGEVRSVARQSHYSFAGVRFEITRGVIDFDVDVPIDPRLNLLAETDVDSLSVSVAITGSSSAPEIAFSSIPSLPEEDVLARLLFGDAVTELSATDAVQLGAAVASLRGGGGMGPINRLRTAIGLDRLRLLPADAAFGRGASIALGKSFGRRAYVEIITDGAGYNASEVEFRVTNWLSLLGSVNTLGRQSATLEVSRDY